MVEEVNGLQEKREEMQERAEQEETAQSVEEEVAQNDAEPSADTDDEAEEEHEENPTMHEVEPGHFVRCTCYKNFHFDEKEGN